MHNNNLNKIKWQFQGEGGTLKLPLEIIPRFSYLIFCLLDVKLYLYYE